MSTVLKLSKSTGLSRVPEYRIGLVLWTGVMLLAQWSIGAGLLRAEVPTRIEPAYADAVLAYNSHDFNRAMALVDELISKYPLIQEFLELKALILKSENSTEKSAETYSALIAVGHNAGKSDAELASYHFELGLAYYREKHFDKARPELVIAAENGFNAPSSRFFLGLMDFQDGNLDSSEKNFAVTAEGPIAELKLAAIFYLGQIQARLSDSSGATQSFVEARKLASESEANPQTDPEARKVALQIRDAADNALKPYDQSGWFGNVSLLFGYDSNSISSPSTSGSGLGATAKASLAGGVGYASSPLRSLQWVPSYRGSYNYNFAGANTLQGEFFSHDFSLYVTKNPLARTSYGLKIEPIYTFQDQPNSDSSGSLSRHYGGYSFVVPLGPYLRWGFKPHWALSTELYFSPGKYLTDDSTNSPTLQRSGLDTNLKIGVKNDRGSRYFNPGASLILDANRTQGDQFKSSGGTLEFTDTLRPSEALNVFVTLDLGGTSYSNAVNSDATVSGRADKTFVFDVSANYRLTARYSLLGTINYTNNSSNDSAYQYSRSTIMLGGSYTF